MRYALVMLLVVGLLTSCALNNAKRSVLDTGLGFAEISIGVLGLGTGSPFALFDIISGTMAIGGAIAADEGVQ